MKSDSALRDVMTFEEGGERYSMYYLQPRSQEDLRRRNRAHRKIADFCFGLMGRTPDAFAGNLTGLFNRRYMYAAIHWAMENHSQLIDIMRELMGGGQFQFPASIDVLEDPELRDLFETFWTAGEFAAADRMKLFKLAWDLVGSDHASRATSYEKFFVGPAFAVRNYNFINAPWDELHAAVEDFMGTYGTGEAGANAEPARRQQTG